MSQLTGQALLDARDRAAAVKLVLAEEFWKTALPVEWLSIVFAADEDLPGVAVELSRDPTPEEIPLLPNDRDGVPIRYYGTHDGHAVKYRRWDGPSA